MESDKTPLDIENMKALAAHLSISDLKKLNKKNPHLYHFKVEMHVRLAYPITFLVLLLIGLPCVLIPETKNILLGIGICLIVCLLYIIVFIFFTDMGNKGDLSPLAAAWMPLIIFASAGITAIDAVRT